MTGLRALCINKIGLPPLAIRAAAWSHTARLLHKPPRVREINCDFGLNHDRQASPVTGSSNARLPSACILALLRATANTESIQTWAHSSVKWNCEKGA